MLTGVFALVLMLTGVFALVLMLTGVFALVLMLTGVFALVFACWSRSSAAMDWEGARRRGQIAFILSVVGIVISIVLGLGFVLVVFSKDNSTS